MKNLITASFLGLALVAGSASADKIKLMDEELDNVNAGLALAFGRGDAAAAGVFFSYTNGIAETAAVSVPGFISLSGSSARSVSVAF